MEARFESFPRGTVDEDMNRMMYTLLRDLKKVAKEIETVYNTTSVDRRKKQTRYAMRTLLAILDENIDELGPLHTRMQDRRGKTCAQIANMM